MSALTQSKASTIPLFCNSKSSSSVTQETQLIHPYSITYYLRISTQKVQQSNSWQSTIFLFIELPPYKGQNPPSGTQYRWYQPDNQETLWFKSMTEMCIPCYTCFFYFFISNHFYELDSHPKCLEYNFFHLLRLWCFPKCLSVPWPRRVVVRIFLCCLMWLGRGYFD